MHLAVLAETNYPLHLHPAIDHILFKSPDDIVMPQLDINTLVRPCNYYRVLIQGFLVSAAVTLVTEVINGVSVSSLPLSLNSHTTRSVIL
jgi:hypothetical protein